MKVCKTNGLHPVLLEAGIEGVWTPKLIPRIGYCDYGCVLCTVFVHRAQSGVYPFEEKREIALGKARIDHNRCIPWVGYARLPELEKEWQDFNCGVCEEVCPVPTKAIHFNTYVDAQQREIRRPFVREDVCVGCGFCEKVCPVLGTSAIVEGIQPQTQSKTPKRDFKQKFSSRNSRRLEKDFWSEYLRRERKNFTNILMAAQNPICHIPSFESLMPNI